MSSNRPSEPEPVTALVVRTCAIIIHDRHICLIHRQRKDGDQYSLPGGLVHADEEVPDALARELKEELNLDLSALREQPELRWVQDQKTTRPETSEPFRRLHLIHVLHLPSHARQTIAATEQDAEDHTRVVWPNLKTAAGLHLYPSAGEAIDTLVSGPAPGAPVLLSPITDKSYRWR